MVPPEVDLSRVARVAKASYRASKADFLSTNL